MKTKKCSALFVIAVLALLKTSYFVNGMLLSDCMSSDQAPSPSVTDLCRCEGNVQWKIFKCGNGTQLLGELFSSTASTLLRKLTSDVKEIYIKGNADILNNTVALRPDMFERKSVEKLTFVDVKLSPRQTVMDSPTTTYMFDKIKSTLSVINFTNAGVNSDVLSGKFNDGEDSGQYYVYAALVGYLPNLKTLILDNNLDLHTPPDAGDSTKSWFQGLPRLELLSLVGTGITAWTPPMKLDCPNLKVLNISQNCFGNFKNLLIDLAKNVNVPLLQEIDVSLQTISDQPRISCPSYTVSEFPSSFCSNFSAVRHFLIRNAALDLAPNIDYGSWVNCSGLREVDFSMAKSIKISSNDFSKIVPQVKVLKFRGSKIDHLTSGAFRQFNLTELDFTGAQIDQNRVSPRDVFMGASIESLKLARMNLTVLEPEILLPLSSSLYFLDLSDNAVPDITKVLQGLSRLRTVVMSGMQLNNLPFEALNSTISLEKIDLSRNKLSQLDDAIFAQANNLKEIVLHYNSLTSIPNSLKKPSIVKLDLSNNLLATFPEDFVNYFATTALSLLNLNLASNPWNCSCSLSKLNSWLRNENGLSGGYQRVCNATGKAECPVCKNPMTPGNNVYVNDAGIFSGCTPTTTVRPGDTSVAPVNPGSSSLSPSASSQNPNSAIHQVESSKVACSYFVALAVMKTLHSAIVYGYG
ncbi:leucine-rich repeat transmembrane neuronal protein 3-like [Paramacrobiotus metropolitanus]|uniref:leucine-rich repeat transmembrane neuronal protein 3-like n=1 Tax=Paramacrobiotus metropolitanus TaxID=2943436 RepID=UPI0024464343|nr:leucine-rich repeat transmembrane neuronal protein 3-like [Paramacrobiotus metropolitanus]